MQCSISRFREPEKAFRLKLEVFKKTYAELEKEERMYTLWAKLRVVLEKTFTGQFLNEIEPEEKNCYLKKNK